MITVRVSNNVCKIAGPAKETNKLYKDFQVKHPAAFHVQRYMPKGWDGKINFMTNAGSIKSGLLQYLVDLCDKYKIKYELYDDRIDDIRLKRKYNPDLDMRDYQRDGAIAVIKNEIVGIRWPRGTIKVATNGGKTYMSADIHNHYQTKSIFLMNSKELFEDAIADMPKLITHGTVGWISSKEIKWGDFMICMVSTMKNRLPQIIGKLAAYRVLIVDECDMAANKTNKKVIEALYHTVVRVGLSGTINASKLKKDLPKNMTLEGFFGKELYAITNRMLIDKGVSSEVAVKFVRGNTEDTTYGDWMEDMTQLIVNNKKRNRKILKRSAYHWQKGRKNQLIISQRQAHIVKLYKIFKKHYGDTARIEWVHHKRKERFKITKDFMEGKIDILIGSMILKRGKNFKMMDYMCNAGGGKSPENILQLIGRAFRGCKHYEDLWDLGLYLKKWSRKRHVYYKNEKLQVTNKYK